MIKPRPQIKLRHSDTGEIISVKVLAGGKELSPNHPDYIAAVEKLKNYGSSIR
jgi:hypothetical protein